MTRGIWALWGALLLLPGFCRSAPAIMLVEQAGESAAFRIDNEIVVLQPGDPVASTGARVKHINREGVVLELPAGAGQPAALLKLRRGENLRLPVPVKNDSPQPVPVLETRRVAAPASAAGDGK